MKNTQQNFNELREFIIWLVHNSKKSLEEITGKQEVTDIDIARHAGSIAIGEMAASVLTKIFDREELDIGEL